MKEMQWQMPISEQGNGAKSYAHYFEQSRHKHRQVKTACGKMVTPGFAVRPTEVKKCIRCLRVVGYE